MMKLLHLGRDERGASIIEMALVAPVFASLLIGMVDLSRGYSEKLMLEQAAQRAIEKAMQGKKETDLFDTLQEEGAEAADVDERDVVVNYWLECDGVSQNTSRATMAADYEKVCTSGQSFARYVTIEIPKTYRPMFRVRFAGSNSDGTFNLKGKAGIRVQ